jgi:hygromycin-B 4-O-kinase
VIGIEEATKFLVEHFSDEIVGVESLPGGHWSQAYGFRADDRDLVIRFGQHLEDFLKDQRAASLSSKSLPVPEILQIGHALGGHFCISQRVYGEMLDGLDAAGMVRIVPSLLETLDGLRKADPDLLLDAPKNTWADQLLNVVEETERVFGWHNRMLRSPAGMAAYESGLAFLRERVSSLSEANHIVHNDLLHFNVLVSNDSIVGVIDWGNAIRGDFLYDLAMFSFYSPWYPAMAGINWIVEARNHYDWIGLDVPDMDRRLHCYEVHLGLSGIAYAAFKENWSELELNASRMMSRF